MLKHSLSNKRVIRAHLNKPALWKVVIIDFVDMINYACQDDGYAWILTGIDVY